MSAETVAIHRCAVCDAPNMIGNAQTIYVTAVCAVKVFGLEAVIATLCEEHREVLEHGIKVWEESGADLDNGRLGVMDMTARIVVGLGMDGPHCPRANS